MKRIIILLIALSSSFFGMAQKSSEIEIPALKGEFVVKEGVQHFRIVNYSVFPVLGSLYVFFRDKNQYIKFDLGMDELSSVPVMDNLEWKKSNAIFIEMPYGIFMWDFENFDLLSEGKTDLLPKFSFNDEIEIETVNNKVKSYWERKRKILEKEILILKEKLSALTGDTPTEAEKRRIIEEAIKYDEEYIILCVAYEGTLND